MPDPTPAPDLTVAIVACDNERTIARTLASARAVAGRVVVVDSGSTDGTLDLCRQAGARIIEHPWEGYVRQKQFALERCETTWVLCLDSDESLDDEAAEAARRAVAENDPGVAGYEFNRRVWLGDAELRHAWQPEWRARLVRQSAARWAGYDPHDRIDVDGRVERLAGLIRHDAFADVGELVRKAVGHGLTTARSYHEMGRSASRIGLFVSPASAVIKQLVFKMAWLDGWRGWVAAYSTGLHAAVKQMRLMELQHGAPAASRDGDGR